MMELVPKSTSINLRITPQFRKELQQLADYRGLTLSSLAHSLLIRAMRQEKANEPDAFAESERLVNGKIYTVPGQSKTGNILTPKKNEGRKRRVR